MNEHKVGSVEINGKAVSNKPVMSEQARAARAEYKKNWRIRNADKIRQYEVDFWERKARENDVTLIDTVKNTTSPVSVSRSEISVSSYICLNCGNEFEAKRKSARFCSDTCRVKFNRKSNE